MSLLHADRSDRPTTRLLTATVFLGLNTGAALLLLGAAWLRETPQFWFNSGGYPVLLRELVKFGFPPCYCADVVLVVAATVVLLRHHAAHKPLAHFGLLLAAVQTVLLASVLLVALANNVDNLINGRPWHWKAESAGAEMRGSESQFALRQRHGHLEVATEHACQ